MAQLLLQHGADVAGQPSNEGTTALMLAAVGGQCGCGPAVATAWCRCGGSKQTMAATALMFARANRHEAVARLLREHGGDSELVFGVGFLDSRCGHPIYRRAQRKGCCATSVLQTCVMEVGKS